MSRKPRGLHPDEQALWQRVADTANPLDKARQAKKVPISAKKPAIAADQSTNTFAPPAFRVGEKADTALPSYGMKRENPLRMDKKAFSKMKRGKSVPEARIDLHGMTAAAAHTALTAFLLRAHDQGLRLVLVITGKGRGGDTHGPVPQRVGVLRQQLPHWVSIPPLHRVVLQTTEAHQKHGGSGAFYVYLTRRR